MCTTFDEPWLLLEEDDEYPLELTVPTMDGSNPLFVIDFGEDW